VPPVATSEELYATPIWAAPSGQATASEEVAVTVTGHVAELLPVFGFEETVAVLETVPDVPGPLTMRTTVATPLASTVPREQLTVLVPEQDPCDGVAETYVVPAGRASVTVTFDARLTPVFVTTML